MINVKWRTKLIRKQICILFKKFAIFIRLQPRTTFFLLLIKLGLITRPEDVKYAVPRLKFVVKGAINYVRILANSATKISYVTVSFFA